MLNYFSRRLYLEAVSYGVYYSTQMIKIKTHLKMLKQFEVVLTWFGNRRFLCENVLNPKPVFPFGLT